MFIAFGLGPSAGFLDERTPFPKRGAAIIRPLLGFGAVIPQAFVSLVQKGWIVSSPSSAWLASATESSESSESSESEVASLGAGTLGFLARGAALAVRALRFLVVLSESEPVLASAVGAEAAMALPEMSRNAAVATSILSWLTPWTTGATASISSSSEIWRGSTS